MTIFVVILIAILCFLIGTIVEGYACNQRIASLNPKELLVYANGKRMYFRMGGPMHIQCPCCGLDVFADDDRRKYTGFRDALIELSIHRYGSEKQ
jgi:hypothetical protein